MPFQPIVVRYGEPVENVNFDDPRLPQRFWDKIVPTEYGCWIWTAGTYPFGYGMFKLNKKMHAAHRLIAELDFGKLPSKVFVLHACDNPPCVNPRHLSVGTPRDNMKDRSAKGRTNQPRAFEVDGFCVKGHAVDEVGIKEYTKPNGRLIKTCMACHNLWDAKRKENWNKKQSRKGWDATGLCKQGHDITNLENVQIVGGYRVCKTCRTRSTKKAEERKRLKRQQG